MHKKFRKSRAPGHVCFRFSETPYTETKTVESILNANLDGPEFTKFDTKIPLAELCGSFAESYKFMAHEFGKVAPGCKRGLKEGDWMVLRSFPASTNHLPATMYLLVASWRYKSALEKYCSVISWTEDMENAVYIFKPGYPKGIPGSGSVGFGPQTM